MTSGITTVPKKKPGEASQASPPKTTVKLAVDLHKMARTVASDLGLELADYLDQVLRPIVQKAHKAMGDRIAREGK